MHEKGPSAGGLLDGSLVVRDLPIRPILVGDRLRDFEPIEFPVGWLNLNLDQKQSAEMRLHILPRAFQLTSREARSPLNFERLFEFLHGRDHGMETENPQFSQWRCHTHASFAQCD
jgi:hypothetical protein